MPLPYKYNSIIAKIGKTTHSPDRNIEFRVDFVSRGLEGFTNIDEPGGIHQIIDSNKTNIGTAKKLIGSTCFAYSEIAFLPKPNTPDENEKEVIVKYYLDNKLIVTHKNPLVDGEEQPSNSTPSVILVFRIEE